MTDTTQFSVRMPYDLEKKITERTRFTRRSRNAEIMHMLEQLMRREEQDNEAALRAAERSPPLD